MEKVAVDHGLNDHLVTGTRVTNLRWPDDDRRWTLRTEDGQTPVFSGRRHDVCAPHSRHPRRGAVWWLSVSHVELGPHEIDCGERVASIGMGARAVGPPIATYLGRLTQKIGEIGLPHRLLVATSVGVVAKAEAAAKRGVPG